MRFLLVACVLGACSGDKPTEIDANPAGPRCSMQPYDLCNAEEQCTSNLCQNFPAFQVCTVGCDATEPCPPDRTGAAVPCEAGICKPSVPNMCHL